MSKTDAPRRPAPIKVPVVRLDHAGDLPLPAYQSRGAAGIDLTAAIDAARPVRLAPGARALIPTGLALAIPEGYEAQVRPRSGLALKHGVSVLNSPGTIDSDYRGEVGVILINLGQETFEIHRGDRIAQIVVAPVARARLVARKRIEQTERGSGGYGSTGAGAKRGAPAAANPFDSGPTKPGRKKSVATGQSGTGPTSATDPPRPRKGRR